MAMKMMENEKYEEDADGNDGSGAVDDNDGDGDGEIIPMTSLQAWLVTQVSDQSLANRFKRS